MSSLGDVALALPALVLLRARTRQAHIVFLTKRTYAPLAAACPAVDEVMVLEPADAGALGTLALAARVRRRRFAAVYDLHGNLRSRLISVLSGAPDRRRVEGRSLGRRWLVAQATARRWLGREAPPVSSGAGDEGTPRAALAAARVIEPRVHTALLSADPVLELPAAAVAGAAARLAALPHPRVALCPGARHATKRWPGFAALAAALAERGAGVVAVLGPDDVWPGAGDWPEVRGSLIELAAVIAGCDAAVGNDSGLTHVAAAAGTPAVVMFGPTVPAFGFRPAGRHRVVERLDLECRPCSVHGGRSCPRGDHACLLGIAPAAVLDALDRLIGSPRHELVDAR
jgi:ADP-heptose:LPS heptosyltransferase